MTTDHFTTVKCREHVPEYEANGMTYDECMDEIEIEWNTVPGELQPNGTFLCKWCGEEKLDTDADQLPCADLVKEGHEEHEFEEQMEEGGETVELVSYRTYCWHPLTRAQAMEWLSDEMQGQAEAAYERMMDR